MSAKIFTNDLEDAMTRLYEKGVDLLHPKDSAQTLDLLGKYMSVRLRLRVNGKDLPLNMIGFENEQEVTWVYLEAQSDAEPKFLEVSNSILYDYIEAQTNIVHVTFTGKTRSSKVSHPDTLLNFSF